MADRLSDFVEAIIAGTHAHQVLMAAGKKQGDGECFTAGDADGLRELDEAASELLSLSPEAIRQWVADGAGRAGQLVCTLLDAGITLPERLPVSVATSFLNDRSPQAGATAIRSLAALYQMTLEEVRDGDDLQSLFSIFIALGLPVCLDDLGLPYGDADLDGMAGTLAASCCGAPYDVSPNGWRLSLQKIKHWGEKFSGRITAKTYAVELLAGELEGLLPQIRSVPPTRLCVLGHSFSMHVHWSSHGTFPCIAEVIFQRENPSVEFSFVNEGGLRASRAYQVFLEKALATRPDILLLVVQIRDDESHEALGKIIRETRNTGARVVLFDSLVWPGQALWGDPSRAVGIAKDAGGEVMEVCGMLEKHPQRDRFTSLDGIHMGPEYHKFMAVRLMDYLLRSAQGS